MGFGEILSAPRKWAFWVGGKPLGDPRPRATIRGGRPHVHHDSKADPWKHSIRAACVAAKVADGLEPLRLPFEEGPVSVRLGFCLSRPKSHFRTGRFAGQLKPSAPAEHTTKPDVDNLAKTVLDAIGRFGNLDPLMWLDDAQVSELIVSKRYGDPPGVSVLVSAMKPWNEIQLVDPFSLTPGEALELVRRRSGMNLEEVAGLYGVGHYIYRQWEMDERPGVPRVRIDRLELREQCWLLRRREALTRAQIQNETGLSKWWIGRYEKGDTPDGEALVLWWKSRIGE